VCCRERTCGSPSGAGDRRDQICVACCVAWAAVIAGSVQTTCVRTLLYFSLPTACMMQHLLCCADNVNTMGICFSSTITTKPMHAHVCTSCAGAAQASGCSNYHPPQGMAARMGQSMHNTAAAKDDGLPHLPHATTAQQHTTAH
jgi:hypothetical protein